MTCSFAAVEPISDSALPIRAELSGGPDKIGTYLRSPKKSEIFEDLEREDGDIISYQ